MPPKKKAAASTNVLTQNAVETLKSSFVDLNNNLTTTFADLNGKLSPKSIQVITLSFT